MKIQLASPASLTLSGIYTSSDHWNLYCNLAYGLLQGLTGTLGNCNWIDISCHVRWIFSVLRRITRRHVMQLTGWTLLLERSDSQPSDIIVNVSSFVAPGRDHKATGKEFCTARNPGHDRWYAITASLCRLIRILFGRRCRTVELNILGVLRGLPKMSAHLILKNMVSSSYSEYANCRRLCES